MFKDNTLFQDFSLKFNFFILFFAFFLLNISACSKAETYEGTISDFSFFVRSTNTIPLFYSVRLTEIEGKIFIITKENVGKFGFKPVGKIGPLKHKGRPISFSNMWLESESTECIGKKVKIRAKNKVFFKKSDNTDIQNHFEVIQIEWTNKK